MFVFKGPFRDPQPHPPFFSKKIEIFIPVEACRYTIFVLKIFLTNLLVWWNYHRICAFFMLPWKFQHTVAYVTVWYSKMCITHNRNLRIDWKFWNKLIQSISTELCHKNSMLGSQNGPLNLLFYHLSPVWPIIPLTFITYATFEKWGWNFTHNQIKVVFIMSENITLLSVKDRDTRWLLLTGRKAISC